MINFSNNLLNKNNELILKENSGIFFDDFNDSKNFVIKIIENANVKLSFFTTKNFEGQIDIHLDKNCSVEIYFADFAINDVKSKVNIFLDESSKSIFHLASLTTGDANKNINVCAYHDGPNTYSFVDNYGVVKGNGKLVFDGVSYIKNGSVKSKTRQNAKIMVFDKDSIGIAKPILKIDENDVEASHGAVVGKISDEHLFYLTSRGLSDDQAKVLITYGYLKPIMVGFDETTQNQIENIIERGM